MIVDRVVMDTNVWLSAILTKKLDRLASLVHNFNVSIYTCDELTREIIRNLEHNPFFVYNVKNKEIQISIFKDLTIHQPISLRFDRASDSKDNFLFDLAYTIKSHYIVTSEMALLNMKHVNKINLVSPVEFFKFFGMKW